MKKLLIFTIWQLGDEVDLSDASNMWYIRRYEDYFDEITHVFLCGNLTRKEYRLGRSRYVSLGSGKHKEDLILSPLRLYRYAKEYKPAAYLTCELVWLFWVVPLVKLFLGAKIYLLPITHPEAMYKLTKRSLSGVLPIWVERWLLALSYRFADYVVTARNVGSYVDWMSAIPVMRKKLIVTESLPESIPTEHFFDELRAAKEKRTEVSPHNTFKLICVVRLHVEKAVDHLIRMMEILKNRGVPAELTIIGDGDDRQRLEKMTQDLGLTDRIVFLGWKKNGELPDYLVNADAFVAPSAGGSLREAALCGIPIISYDLDWIQGLLKDRETFLAVSPDDYSEMADKVQELLENAELRRSLADNIERFGWDIWSDKEIDEGIHKIYDNHLKVGGVAESVRSN